MERLKHYSTLISTTQQKNRMAKLLKNTECTEAEKEELAHLQEIVPLKLEQKKERRSKQSIIDEKDKRIAELEAMLNSSNSKRQLLEIKDKLRAAENESEIEFDVEHIFKDKDGIQRTEELAFAPKNEGVRNYMANLML